MSFLKHILFSPNVYFFHGKNYSFEISFFSLIRELIISKNIELNKYSLILFMKYLIFSLISFLFSPLAIIIYFTKFRFILIDTSSVGEFLEFAKLYIKRNKKLKKKLILLSPNSICSNLNVNDIFSKELRIVKNFFLCFILSPLTYIYFITVKPCRLKKVLFPVHKYKSNINYIYDDNLIEEISLNANTNYNLNQNFFTKKKFFEKINLKIKKKLCVLNIRNHHFSKIRNDKIKKFEKSLNYLIKKGYFIINISNKKVNLDKNIINLNNHPNLKELQIYSIYACDLFVGQISGLISLARFLNKKMILTDLALNREALPIEKYVCIFKKIFYKGKKLKLDELFKLCYDQSIWDSKKLSKKIKIIDNSENEIFLMTKNFILKKNKNNNINVLKKFKIHKSIFNNLSFKKCDNKYFEKNLV